MKKHDEGEMGMDITTFKVEDTKEIVALFYETVHCVNAMDYGRLAIHAWAPKADKKRKETLWRKTLYENMTYVAWMANKIIGFADLTHQGYLDRIYVHHAYQRQGVATLLLSKLERIAIKKGLPSIQADVSITAKPFFETFEYSLVHEQVVEKKGVSMVNYRMMKHLEVL